MLDIKQHFKCDCKTCKNNSLIFKSFNDKDLDVINNNRFELVYKHDEVICKEGMEVTHLICVREGNILL